MAKFAEVSIARCHYNYDVSPQTIFYDAKKIYQMHGL